MRYITIFLLLCLSASVALASSQLPQKKKEVKIFGNWQVTTVLVIKNNYRTVTLEVKSDNEILGNNPDKPEPLPATVAVTCASEQEKTAPVVKVYYLNMLFNGSTQHITAAMNDAAPIALTGAVSQVTSGINAGTLLSLDEQNSHNLLVAMQNHKGLTLQIEGDESHQFDVRFSIDSMDKALAPVRTYCKPL